MDVRFARALALGIAWAALGPVHALDAPRTFPLVVHATSSTPDDFLAPRIEAANRLFAPAGVGFVVRETRPLDGRHANLVTREDRDALGALASRRAIDVFVVDSLMDVDAPPEMRRGVHWRDRGQPGVRYVIVIGASSETVLAHELGHYFGLAHSDVVDNLMSYARSGGAPFLDATQLARIRASATRLRRVVPPIAPPASATSR